MLDKKKSAREIKKNRNNKKSGQAGTLDSLVGSSEGQIDRLKEGLSHAFRCNANHTAETCDPREVLAMDESKFIEVVSAILKSNMLIDGKLEL